MPPRKRLALDARGLIPEVARRIDHTIYDDELRTLLAEAAETTPTKYEDALRRLKRQINAARRTILYTGQSAEYEGLASAYRPVAGKPQALETSWSNLVSDAGNVALVLRDAFDAYSAANPRGKSTQVRVQLRVQAEQVLRALQSMLHAVLYQQRVQANEGTGARTFSTASQRDMAAMFRQREEILEKLAREWGIHRALPRGEVEASYAVEYNTWSLDFAHPLEDELGWGRFARYVSRELRYRHYSFELRQRWKEISNSSVVFVPFRMLWALFVEAFKWTTGFGLKPMRFAVTTFLTLLTFTTLYWLNDLYTGAAISWSGTARDLYIAVVYLTSVGSDHTPGGFAPVLIGVESLLGYFLLSVLAAMLFAWFTDR